LKIHIVQKGETLYDIAAQYGVSFDELQKLNSQLSTPDMIMPGMKVKIPGSAKTVQSESKTKEEKKEVQKPYMDVSPKPEPVMKKEEQKQPQKKPNIPMHPIPVMPIQQSDDMKQVDIDIEKNKTINFHPMPPKPEMEMQQKPEMKKAHMNQPAYPHQQPMYHQPMFHDDCGCGGQMPSHQQAPMMQYSPMGPGNMYPQTFAPMPYDDCGCGGQMPSHQQAPMMQYSPMGPGNMYPQTFAPMPYDDCGCGGQMPSHQQAPMMQYPAAGPGNMYPQTFAAMPYDDCGCGGEMPFPQQMPMMQYSPAEMENTYPQTFAPDTYTGHKSDKENLFSPFSAMMRPPLPTEENMDSNSFEQAADEARDVEEQKVYDSYLQSPMMYPLQGMENLTDREVDFPEQQQDITTEAPFNSELTPTDERKDNEESEDE